jgi:nicotinate-nucleotide pyrophosphorylase (carboxylating)
MVGPLLAELIRLALAEDLSGGDLTTQALVAPGSRAVGRALAKSPLVACGAEVFARVFYEIDAGVRVERKVDEGAKVEPGTVLWEVEGATRSILMGERTALNFAQRMSGVATLTRRFVDAVPKGLALRVTDTRKTTPGLRAIERYAVRAGGGSNHRNDLGSAVLIKDNHIEAAGSITAALESAKRFAPHTARVEIEVESLEALEEALRAGADIVMLDNFAPDALVEAVRRTRGKALCEVSGGVTLDRIPELARAGVDVVSIGALTHSAPAADISLDIERLS